MQRFVIGAFVVAALACPGIAGLGLIRPAMAGDCSKDVEAAIQKQRSSKAFRIETSQPTADGPVNMRVDYLLPDRMLQTVTGSNLIGEQQTLLVRERAFAGTNGAYQELLPQYAQSVIAEFLRSVGKPENMAAFTCLGKVTFEGKTYLGYKSVIEPKGGGAAGQALGRVIYVDPDTGLPAYNVVVPASGEGEPVLKVVYSYPTDIVIEAPENAPIQRSPH